MLADIPCGEFGRDRLAGEKMAVGEVSGDGLAFQEPGAGGKLRVDENIGTEAPDKESIALVRESAEFI